MGTTAREGASTLASLTATLAQAFKNLADHSGVEKIEQTPRKNRKALQESVNKALERIQGLEEIARDSPVVENLINQTLQGIYISMDATDEQKADAVVAVLLDELNRVA